MDDKTKKFLEETFPAGSYYQVTILVRKEDLPKLVDNLKKTEMKLAIMPHVQAASDFENPDFKGTKQ